jgi:hypothetical protein
MSKETPIAYSVSDPRLPWTRASLYRWESLGLIKLLRIGGKTLIHADTIDDIFTGRIKLPGHSSRTKRPEPKARGRRKRKAKA